MTDVEQSVFLPERFLRRAGSQEGIRNKVRVLKGSVQGLRKNLYAQHYCEVVGNHSITARLWKPWNPYHQHVETIAISMETVETIKLKEKK